MEKYSIGEVAALLNISRDMVRYYEKQGVIRAKRKRNNNYRYYDTKDIFWLLEAIEYKNLNIHLNDISSLRLNDYEKQTVNYLDDYIRKQEAELQYKKILIRRLKELRKRYLLGSVNEHSFWVQEIPASHKVFLVSGHGDVYERILPNTGTRILLQDQYSPFTDSVFTFKKDEQKWYLSINDDYLKQLNIKPTDDFIFHPAYLALCTHIDIGEFGAFDPSELLKFFNAYKSQHKRNPDIPLNALLLSRGASQDKFHRIVELRYPIQY